MEKSIQPGVAIPLLLVIALITGIFIWYTNKESTPLILPKMVTRKINPQDISASPKNTDKKNQKRTEPSRDLVSYKNSTYGFTIKHRDGYCVNEGDQDVQTTETFVDIQSNCPPVNTPGYTNLHAVSTIRIQRMEETFDRAAGNFIEEYGVPESTRQITTDGIQGYRSEWEDPEMGNGSTSFWVLKGSYYYYVISGLEAEALVEEFRLLKR